MKSEYWDTPVTDLEYWDVERLKLEYWDIVELGYLGYRDPLFDTPITDNPTSLAYGNIIITLSPLVSASAIVIETVQYPQIFRDCISLETAPHEENFLWNKNEPSKECLIWGYPQMTFCLRDHCCLRGFPKQFAPRFHRGNSVFKMGNKFWPFERSARPNIYTTPLGQSLIWGYPQMTFCLRDHCCLGGFPKQLAPRFHRGNSVFKFSHPPTPLKNWLGYV